MRAMILAAGEGLRLRPLTATEPKALIRVGGHALIDYALDAVARAGIGEVIINLHHLGERIREHVGDGGRWHVRVHYSTEATLLGSGGGILHARELLGGEPFVTLNADTIIDIDLDRVVEFHRDHRATATMVLRKDARMEEFGIIRTGPDSRVERFLEHARPGGTGPLEPYMYTGVQLLEPAVFAYMPAGGVFSITEATYPQMLAAGEPIFGYPFGGRWLTVGTPEELERARTALPEAALDSPERSGLS